ncbi:M28 family metallopeptidase [Pendulispora albinea]|uniref:M28 family peptidase n=1 Tax=Pendulispora albinea TaxID=2741071 RepID=A0ABZ2M8J5_9BACT
MMKRHALSWVMLAVAGIWACSAGRSEDPGASGRMGSAESTGAAAEPAPASVILADDADSDPMEHIRYFASDSMKGRNSPSPEFDSCAKYVTDRLVKYGLTGPNSGDPNGAYAQTFTQSTLAPAGLGLASAHGDDAHQAGDDAHPAHGAGSFGTTLFERGSYVEGAAAAAGNTHNVLGRLEGTGAKKNEVIVVMAHLDHIGTTSSGVVRNGADDNASGSAVLVASLPALAQAKANDELNRSVLFVWTAAEEDGLIGSKYFVDHPIAGVGLSEIVGVINFDMVARWDANRLSIIDTKSDGTTSYLSSLFTQANAKLPAPFGRINHDIAQYARRQDGASFYDKGEDVLFVFEGLSNPEGGGDLNPDYHAAGDDVSKILADNDGEKPRKVRDLLIELVKLASNASR